jgi:hypothetical protein
VVKPIDHGLIAGVATIASIDVEDAGTLVVGA